MRFLFFISFISMSLFFACGGEEKATTAAADNTSSDTAAATNTAKKMDVSAIDISGITSPEKLHEAVVQQLERVKPKVEEMNSLGRELNAIENVPAEAKADVQAAIQLLEQAGGQVAKWEETVNAFADMNKVKETMDSTTIMTRLTKEMERGQFVEKQMKQLIAMGKGQLNRIKSN